MQIVVILLVAALIPAAIAASKGRHFLLWYAYGVALWPVALAHALTTRSEVQKAREAQAQLSPAERELARFAKLRRNGLMTEDEFQEKRRQLGRQA
jgi:hypothetical protein